MAKSNPFRQFARSLQVLRQLFSYRELIKLSRDGTGQQIVDGRTIGASRKVLVIAPHPDDDIFGCGGVIGWHCLGGDKVKVIFIGNGEQVGDPNHQINQQLTSTRQTEATEALQQLGRVATEFWGIPDGTIRPESTLVDRLRAVLVGVDRVYAPWFGEENDDHQGTYDLLMAALANSKLDPEIWLYEVWTPLVPNRFVPLGEMLSSKKAAINCHQSQLADRAYVEGITGLNAYRGMQAETNGPAEAFFATTAEKLHLLLRD